MVKSEHIIHPLEPIYDSESRVMILGSFPSVISRQLNFYYANPHNRFWPVLRAVFEDEANDRITFCHKHHIAIWDVIHSCSIHNSSDTSIHDVVPNNIESLVNHTKVHTIFTTGKKASELYDKYIQLPLEHISLPSTSSANASMRKEDLINVYQIIREKVNEKEKS